MNAFLLKIIASFLIFLNTTMINFSVFFPVITNVTDTSPTASDCIEDKTEALAYNSGNCVNAGYADTKRNSFKISNRDINLVQMLAGPSKTAVLYDKNGNVYLDGTMRTFVISDTLGKQFFENGLEKGRVNTIRFGKYYYECRVRDFTCTGYFVDKGFHVYANKLYMENRLLCKKPSENVTAFGTEIKLRAKDICKIEVSTLSGIKDFGTFSGDEVEYIAFDTKSAGTVGFIIPSDNSTGKIELKKSAGQIVLNIYASYEAHTGINDTREEGGFDLDEIDFGTRIYTDSTHSFDGIKKAATEERNPLEITVEDNTDGSVYEGYDAKRGAYAIKTEAIGFAYAYENPNLRFSAPISITNNGEDRDIYFRYYSIGGGCLESGVLYDENGNLMSADMQICKNFCGDGGEETYSYKDYAYSDMFFPIASQGGTTQKFTAVHLYQNWGNYPLKQLSSIEFHVPYYHLSTGTTETNCIATQFVSDDGWVLPDFRTFSAPMWETQPQHNSMGILKFMTSKSGTKECDSEFSGTRIDSAGPVYADVTNYYTDDLGNYKYSLRHTEMPQTDENRTYCSLKVEFTKAVTYRNFRRDFNLFYINGRFVDFESVFYSDENGDIIVTNPNTDKKGTFHKLGSEAATFGFLKTTQKSYDALPDKNFGCNFSLSVKSATVTKNGVTGEIPLVFRDTSDSDITEGALTADWQTVSFSKNDTIEIDLILLPFGDNLDDDISHALKVREDSCINPAVLAAKNGTAVNDTFVPAVKAENGYAEFSIEGGNNKTAVRVTGLKDCKAPTVYTIDENGIKNELNLCSQCGNDGYDFTTESDGTFTFSFIADLDVCRNYVIQTEQ